MCLAVGLSVGAGAQGTSSSDGAAVTSPEGSTNLGADARQLSRLLGLKPLLAKVEQVRMARACEVTPTPEEIAMRETLVEAFQAATLDTDSVLAELSNEQSELTEMRAGLTSRRNKTAAKLNTAALLTGSGLGVVVSAMQFTTLGSRTQNTGDALGIGGGAASTILSLLAAKKQREA